MNDNKSIQPTGLKSRVMCMLPGCGKEVLHFAHHLKNKHKMNMTCYKVKIKPQAKAETYSCSFRSGVDNDNNTLSANVACSTNTLVGNMNHTLIDEDNHMVNDRNNTLGNSPNIQTGVNTVDDKVVDVENGDQSDFADDTHDDNSSYRLADLIRDTKGETETKHQTTEDDFSLEHLCFIKHQVTFYGLLALLAYLKTGSINDFFKSPMCKDIFGKITRSVLNDIYRYRKYLMSIFRVARFSCYPVELKKINMGVCMWYKRGWRVHMPSPVRNILFVL